MEDIPKDLQSECSICLNVPCRPIVSCCGNRFCHTCIEPIQRNTRKCPLCSNSFNSMPDRQLERTLSEKMVYCSVNDEKDRSCKWKGKLWALEDHLKIYMHPSKGHFGIQCCYCKLFFSQSKVIDHQKKCPARHIKMYVLLRLKLHYQQCPNFPVPCPNGCGADIPRKEILNHINEHCPFKDTGCKVEHTERDVDSFLFLNIFPWA